MPFQSAPNAAEVRVIFSLNGGSKQAGFSLYAKRAASNWDEASLALLADSVRDAVVASYVPVLSQDHSFVGVVATDLEAEFPLRAEVMEAAPVAGTLASPALPNQAAVVGTWIGAAGLAPRRGRIYLPSPAESQVTGSLLTGAAQAALTTAVGDLRTSVEDPAGLADVSQAIISRYSGSTVDATGASGKQYKIPTKRAVAVVNGVTSHRVSSRVDSQRRRAPRETAA